MDGVSDQRVTDTSLRSCNVVVSDDRYRNLRHGRAGIPACYFHAHHQPSWRILSHNCVSGSEHIKL